MNLALEPASAPILPISFGDGAVIHIELAGDPRGKGRPRFARASGRTYTDAATSMYEGNLRLMASRAMDRRRPIDGPVRVHIEAHMPIPVSFSQRKRLQCEAGLVHPTVRPDFDNIIKMLDALNHVVWNDDKQVVEQSFVKRYSTRPRLIVRVQPI